MSVISGYTGAFSLEGTTVGTCEGWSISWQGNNPETVASNTGAMPISVEGVSDWTLEYMLATNTMPQTPGDAAAFIGYNGAERATGNVMIESFAIQCDIEGGGIITGKAKAGANGSLALASGAAITDAQPVTTFGGAACKATWQPVVAGVLGTEADIPDLRNYSLTATRKLNPYSSSSTPNVTKRTAGVWQGVSVGFSFYQGAMSYLTASATRMQPGTAGIVKLYVNATQFFQLNYLRILSTKKGPDVKGGANNAIDVAGNLSSHVLIGSTYTRGQFLKPGGTAIWN